MVFFHSGKAVQQLSVLPSKIKVMILRKIASKMAVWVAWDKASSWGNPIRNCKANLAKTMDAHQDVSWCLQNICTILHKDVYLYPRGGRFTGNSCPVGVYIYKVTAWLMLRKQWGGVGLGMGWGGDDNVPCTCTHGRCYATSCFLHLHTWLVLRNIMFLALAHMVGATQHHVSCTCTHGRCYATSWGGVGLGWGGDDNVPCTCAHGRCYATSCL